jgi:hypothetical protein
MVSPTGRLLSLSIGISPTSLKEFGTMGWRSHDDSTGGKDSHRMPGCVQYDERISEEDSDTIRLRCTRSAHCGNVDFILAAPSKKTGPGEPVDWGEVGKVREFKVKRMTPYSLAEAE